MENYGFIITRHVNSEITNKYWNLCVKYIKFFYPQKKIIVIDDNSNYDYVKNENHDDLYKNVEIIKSEFPGKGELLPFYYYNKNKYFNNAIIIHDSVFIHTRINFDLLIQKNIPVIPLWHFNADRDNYINTYKISTLLNNSINKIDSNAFNNSYFKELVLTIPKMSIEIMNTLKDQLKLRFFNSIGAALFIYYSLSKNDYPVVFINSAIVLINIFYIIKQRKINKDISN
jgi:hypothetical protein